MKTTWHDFIASGTIITFIALLTIVSAFVTYKFLIESIPNFASVMTVFTLFVFFGFFSVIALTTLRKLFNFHEGTFSMDHLQFFLWKLQSVLTQLSMPCIKIIIPIFLRPLMYFLYGAKIGKQVAIGGKILDPFFTTMQDYSIIGEDAVITAHIIANEKFYLYPVLLKKGCTVGVKSIVMPGVVIGRNSILLPGSLLQMNVQVPDNQIWGGNPAKFIREI